MSATNTCKSYIVAASIATVEALKDQGFARWNYPLRSLHHNVKSKLRSSFSQSSKAASTASGVGSEMTKRSVKRVDKNIRKVMEIDCFGPSTFRF